MANIPQRGQPAPIRDRASYSVLARRNYYAQPGNAPDFSDCGCNVPPAKPCCEACRYGQPCGTKLGDPWTPNGGPVVPPLTAGVRASARADLLARRVEPITAYPVSETLRNLRIVALPAGPGPLAGGTSNLNCSFHAVGGGSPGDPGGTSGHIELKCFDEKGGAATVKTKCFEFLGGPDHPPSEVPCDKFEDL
jgi:hypothetical protein